MVHSASAQGARASDQTNHALAPGLTSEASREFGTGPDRGALREVQMPQVSQNYFKAGAVFLLVGIVLGLQMSISGDHATYSAHAHLSLLGWVSCAIFGTYFALNPEKARSPLVTLEFWIIVVSTAVLTGALYLFLLGRDSMEPVVAASSLAYAAGALLFVWTVFAPAGRAAASHGHAHG